MSWKCKSGSVDVSVGGGADVGEVGLPADLAVEAFMKAPGERVDGIVFASLVQELDSGDERVRVSTDDKSSLMQGESRMLSFDLWVGRSIYVVET